MKSLNSLLILDMQIFNSSLKDKKGNIDMTDPRTVHKVDQSDSPSSIDSFIHFFFIKHIAVFFRRITKQPVFTPTLQVIKKRGKSCECLHASDMGLSNS